MKASARNPPFRQKDIKLSSAIRYVTDKIFNTLSSSYRNIENGNPEKFISQRVQSDHLYQVYGKKRFYSVQFGSFWVWVMPSL